MDLTLTVIIPAYNEGNTIRPILEQVIQQEQDGLGIETIVVDDCSVDETAKVVEQFIASFPDRIIRLVRQDKNLGKGAAIRRGIEEATGDFLVIQDADLEYDPSEYRKLLDPILKGKADVVYGSRFMGSDPHRILFFWHSVGNKFLTFLTNMFNNLNLTDMETCYKMFRTDLIQKIYLRENRFGFEPEVTAKISRVPGIRIYEVGISYHGRTYQEGKKINWKDGFRAIYCIIKYSLLRRRVFK
jgi:glycosyltransferase involved in cell wall biosynthesis